MVKGKDGSSRNKSKKRKRKRLDDSDDSEDEYVVSDEETGGSDEDSEDYAFDSFEDTEKEVKKKRVGKTRTSERRTNKKFSSRSSSSSSRKRRRVSRTEDFEFDCDDKSDEDVSLDDGEESLVCEKKETVSKKKHRKRKRSKKKDSVSKRTRKKTVRKKTGLKSSLKTKSKKRPAKRGGKNIVSSDSDFVSSETSDYDYTISEDEREQVQEDCELLRSWRNNKSKGCPRKPLVRKGKEKIVEIEEVKPVCGICLSEASNRKLRGTLDSCSHYFCFSCIIEWSKVESRCPTCKQRFKTITKPSRASTRVGQNVIMIPKRDQVYEPTEDELRGYLDLYQNVTCMVCHRGDNDTLMLLCDLCDSAAHTYCVGLGNEVPEGDWYCDACSSVPDRASSPELQDDSPCQTTSVVDSGDNDSLMLLCNLCDSAAHMFCVGLENELPEGDRYFDASSSIPHRSSSPELQNDSPRQTTPAVNSGGCLDLLSPLSSPVTPLSQGFGYNATSSGTQTATGEALTLSTRRQAQRLVQNIISSDRLRNDFSNASSSNGFSNLHDGPSSSMHGGDLSDSEGAVHGATVQPQDCGIRLVSGNEDHHPSSSRLN